MTTAEKIAELRAAIVRWSAGPGPRNVVPLTADEALALLDVADRANDVLVFGKSDHRIDRVNTALVKLRQLP